MPWTFFTAALASFRSWFGGGCPPGSSGLLAERRAAAWLVRQRGMTLVARNWRNPLDRREEIDLVLRDGASLVFVEVKARAEGARVPGLYAVGPAKRAVLRRAVRAYLAGLPGGARPLRFDVIEVDVESDRRPADWSVRHYQNVPLFAADVRG